MSVDIYRVGLKNPQFNKVSTSELFENADHGIYVAKSCNSRNQLTEGDKRYLWAVYISALKDNTLILSRYNPEDFIPQTIENIKGRISSNDQRFFELLESSNAALTRIDYEFNKRKLEKATFVFRDSEGQAFEHVITNISPFLGNIISLMFK